MGGPGYLVVHESLLYVTDQNNLRIQFFSVLDCNYYGKITCKYKPWAICIYKSIIYVSFSNANEIHKLTLTGELVKIFKLLDYNIALRNTYVRDLAVHDDTLFLICKNLKSKDSLDKIECVSIIGDAKNYIPYKFDNPRFLTFHNDMLYVSDARNIYKFDSDYKLIKSWRSGLNSACIMFFEDLCFTSNSADRVIYVYR